MRQKRISWAWTGLISMFVLGSGCSGYNNSRSSKTNVINPSVTVTSTPTVTPTSTSTPTPTPTPSPTVTVQPLMQTVVHSEIRRNGTNMGPFYVNCPAGYLLTGGGTRLKTYVAGAVKPDSSYPHQTQNAWGVSIGGPQTGHKDNVWEAYAVCLKDPALPNWHRMVQREQVSGSGTVSHNCPIAGYIITDAGTELTNWSGGQNNPQAVYVDENNHLQTRAGNSNTWYVNYICLEQRNYSFARPSEELNAQSPAVTVQCADGKVLAGGAGGYELTNYSGGEVSFKRSLPGLWNMEYEVPPNTSNTWKAYASCVRKP